MVGLKKFVVASMLLGLAGACTPTTGAATATEAEICRAWRGSLPSRSVQDSVQTRAEIGTAYDVQAAACPNFARF